ncbi:MAG TPA: phage tail protein [Acidimicrobiales bacterium]|nr:phage tail protein [Acidimicrobiales bacterium]
MAVTSDEMLDLELPAPLPFSRRGAIDGLRSRMQIGHSLPAVYQGDDFCQRLTTVFDDALSPVVSTLDCFDAYVDPALAPEDFVEWLAGWVAVSLDEAWAPARRRQLVARAVELYRSRGTVDGLVAAVELYTGVTPEVIESGGCGWSEVADSALPGTAQPRLQVIVRTSDPSRVDVRVVERIVAENKPAHLPHTVEITAG